MNLFEISQQYKCHNREHPEKGAAAAKARHPPTLRDFD